MNAKCIAGQLCILCTVHTAEGVSEDWDTGSKPVAKPGCGNRERCFSQFYKDTVGESRGSEYIPA